MGKKEKSKTASVALIIGIVAMLIAIGTLGYIISTPDKEENTTKINPDDVDITTKHGTMTLSELAEIQPGLGTVMIEYGTRFYTMYYAANDSNWGLADYQMKEALEIQEVGELTRPGRAPMLKSFETSYLEPLQKTIDDKDITAFKSAYAATVKGCNACHTANGYGFIEFKLPTVPPPLP